LDRKILIVYNWEELGGLREGEVEKAVGGRDRERGD